MIRGYPGSRAGYVLRGVDDPADQAYLQRHPYLNGPDAEANHRLRRRTREGWMRVEVPAEMRVEVEHLEAPFYGVDPALLADRRARPAGDPLALHPSIEPLLWKVNALPAGAREILDVGCGAAAEIAAMRVLGRGDGVSIRAVDFRRAFTDEVQARYRFEFTPGHWIEFLRGHAAAFDAAFSNHCMEHIYNDPTEVLRAVRGALRPGGAYVFAMPIEMSRSNPFARAYPVLLRGPLYGWMMDAVDCGHPWKADLPELAWRLRDAGFERVEFFLREGGLPYLDAPLLPPFVRADDADWSGAPARSDGQPAAAPLARRIVEEGYRWLYRVKGVLGVNQIKNRRTHEVLVRAWAGPAPRGGA